MKSLIVLWEKLADESASRCCTCATLDRKTVLGRIKHEGISFLTISLPNFGKDFQKSLDQGYVSRNLFSGFAYQAGLPRFLGGFLDRVFDRNSGVLLDDPCIDAILSIRQLTLMFGKILLPCTPYRDRKAMRGYLECEQDVRRNDASLSKRNLSDFDRISSLLFRDAFLSIDREIYAGALIPKHGPGSTSEGTLGNKKYNQKTWPARLNNSFPIWDFLIPNARFSEHLEDVDILEPGSEIPAKVITVPKTLKTPRIIAKEPVAMQYAQQSVLPLILNALDRDDFLSNVIGFDDQSPNQRLALEGSLSGDLATLDLSEASDRVSNQLVLRLFRNNRLLRDAIQDSRSRKADVLGKTVRLAKFASMGSALCFPVEAMVFTTLIFIGIERELNTTLDSRTVKQFKNRVRVYGDDIIVPVNYVQSVVDVLSAFGSKVNVDKSFWTGTFRESCGKEYYAGFDVSIVKVRNNFPTHRKHATEVISMISLRNQLYWSGYWQTCKWLDERIRDLIRHFPVVLPSSPVHGRQSCLGFETQRIGDKLHDPQVKGYVVSSIIPKDNLDGYGALLKFFLKRGGLPSADRKHLERAGRPHAVSIKLRWASAI
jgi:hypothetical protein